MKKILLLMLLASSVFQVSCSSDDNSLTEAGNSQISGTSWELYKEQSGTYIYNYGDCERDVLTFNSNGTALQKFFSPFNPDGSDVENGNCYLQAEIDLEWHDLGNSKYSIGISGFGDGDEFTVSNNEFQIAYSEDTIEYYRKIQ